MEVALVVLVEGLVVGLWGVVRVGPCQGDPGDLGVGLWVVVRVVLEEGPVAGL